MCMHWRMAQARDPISYSFLYQDEHVDVKHKTCMVESCNLQPIWGSPEQGTPIACTEHRMVSAQNEGSILFCLCVTVFVHAVVSILGVFLATRGGSGKAHNAQKCPRLKNNGACDCAVCHVWLTRGEADEKMCASPKQSGHVDVKHYRWAPEGRTVTTWVATEIASKLTARGSEVGVDAARHVCAHDGISRALSDASSVTPGLESSSN